MDEKEQMLNDYIATANSGKYKTMEELNSKFPELSNYDSKLLNDYITTANSGKYKTMEELNSKFPEFFEQADPVKKKPTPKQEESTDLSNQSEETQPIQSEESTPPLAGTSQGNGENQPNIVQQNLQQNQGQPMNGIDPEEFAKQQQEKALNERMEKASEPLSSEKGNLTTDETLALKHTTERLSLSKSQRTSTPNDDMAKKVTYDNANIPWVKRYLDGNKSSIPSGDEDGKTSSHKLAAEHDGDEKWYVIPTIIEVDGELKEVSLDEAKQYSKENKTRIYFNSKEDAMFYSENGLIDHRGDSQAKDREELEATQAQEQKLSDTKKRKVIDEGIAKARVEELVSQDNVLKENLRVSTELAKVRKELGDKMNNSDASFAEKAEMMNEYQDLKIAIGNSKATIKDRLIPLQESYEQVRTSLDASKNDIEIMKARGYDKGSPAERYQLGDEVKKYNSTLEFARITEDALKLHTPEKPKEAEGAVETIAANVAQPVNNGVAHLLIAGDNLGRLVMQPLVLATGREYPDRGILGHVGEIIKENNTKYTPPEYIDFNEAESFGEWAKNTTGQVTREAAGILPEIVMAAYMPQTKLFTMGKVGTEGTSVAIKAMQKVGKVGEMYGIGTTSKFGLEMAALSMSDVYELEKENPEAITATLPDYLLAGAKGYLSGKIMDGIGVTGKVAEKYIVDETGRVFLGKTGGFAAEATAFVGYGALQKGFETGDFSVDEQAAIMGAGTLVALKGYGGASNLRSLLRTHIVSDARAMSFIKEAVQNSPLELMEFEAQSRRQSQLFLQDGEIDMARKAMNAAEFYMMAREIKTLETAGKTEEFSNALMSTRFGSATMGEFVNAKTEMIISDAKGRDIELTGKGNFIDKVAKKETVDQAKKEAKPLTDKKEGETTEAKQEQTQEKSQKEDKFATKEEVTPEKETKVEVTPEKETDVKTTEKEGETTKERVDKEVEGIVEKTMNKFHKDADPKKVNEKVRENSIAYLQKTKWYENATDVQREAAVREVNKQTDLREKSAPSKEKILGQEKKMVTVDEAKALKTQLNLEARAAKEGGKFEKAKAKSYLQKVKEFVKENKLGLGEKEMKSLLGKLPKAINSVKDFNNVTTLLKEKVDANIIKAETAAKEALIEKQLDPNRLKKRKDKKDVSKNKKQYDATTTRFYDNVVKLNNGEEIRVVEKEMPTKTEADREDIIKHVEKELERDDLTEQDFNDLFFAKRALDFHGIKDGKYSDVKESIDRFNDALEYMRGSKLEFAKHQEVIKTRKSVRNDIEKKRGRGEANTVVKGINKKLRRKKVKADMDVNGWFYGNKNFNALMEVLGGTSVGRMFNNKMHQIFKTKINESEITEKEIVGEKEKEFASMLKDVIKTTPAKPTEKVQATKAADILTKVYDKTLKPFVETSKNKVVEETNIEQKQKDGSSKVYDMSKDQAIQMYMFGKNAELRKTLEMPVDDTGIPQGNGFTEKSFKELEKFIGEDGIKIADRMFELYENLYNMQNKVYRQEYGYDLSKLDFYAGHVNRRRGRKKGEVGDLRPRGLGNVTSQSHKKRTTTTNQIIPTSYVETYNRAVKEAAKFTAWKETIGFMNNTLLHPTVTTKMEVNKALGGNFVSELNHQRDVMAGDFQTNYSWVDGVNRLARVGILGLKTVTGMKQTASGAMIASQMRPDDFLHYTTRTMYDMGRKLLTGAETTNTQIVKAIMNHPFVKYRNAWTAMGMDNLDLTTSKTPFDGLANKLYENTSTGKVGTKIKKAGSVANSAKDAAAKASMIAITVMDKAPITVFGGAYIQSRAKKYKGSKITQKDVTDYMSGVASKGGEAVRKSFADWLVVSEATQQSSFKSNLARSRMQDTFGRGVNTFTSAQHQLSIITRSGYRHVYDGAKEGNLQKVGKGVSMLGGVAVTQTLISLMSQKDDLDKGLMAAEVAMAVTVSGIPYIHQMAEAVKWAYSANKKGYSADIEMGIPSVDLLLGVAGDVYKRMNASGEASKAKYERKIVVGLAQVLGVPAGGIDQFMKSYSQFMNGTVRNPFWASMGAAGRQVIPVKNKNETLEAYKTRGVEALPWGKNMTENEVDDYKKLLVKFNKLGDRNKAVVTRYPTKGNYQVLPPVKNRFETMDDIAKDMDMSFEQVYQLLKGLDLMTTDQKKIHKEFVKNKDKYESIPKDYDEIKAAIEN